MVTKAIEYRKWSAGGVTTVFLHQYASCLEPFQEGGVFTFSLAWAFFKRWERRHLGCSSPSPCLNSTECPSLGEVGCVIWMELQCVPGPSSLDVPQGSVL